ncbi:16S rRNA processing protein RimM [hydrothermal vent metagenome]|uniref:16S rRNA processing protein RimM n=1 Tax=hydrothermal vent metagenome TaxID=652676 RepID=A0A1W1EI17_9ZZZZ
MNKNNFLVAQIGRTVGLWGDLKLHFHTDFPEQFQIGSVVKSDRGSLEIIDINHSRSLVRFKGYEGVDYAKKLTNAKIYTDYEDTRNSCKLEDGEHFWFDIIGCKLDDNGEILGEVVDIQRMLDLDYLIINSSKKLRDEGFSKSFLVPYIPRYIIKSDIDSKVIFSQDTKDILEAS